MEPLLCWLGTIATIELSTIEASQCKTPKGILLESHKYPDEGKHIVIAWQVLRHDDASNTNVSKSTIDDKIDVCMSAKARAPGC